MAMAEAYSLILIQKSFSPEDVGNYRLIICATNQSELNQLVAATATQKNIPVNVVDNPALCSFIFPAIIDRSPVIAAISTGGRSPVLARLMRAKLESLLPARLGELAQLAAQFRTKVKNHIADSQQRRIFWERMLQGSVAEQVFSGQFQQAQQQLCKALAEVNPEKFGEVYLVGAGPGDPDLLTFRALRLIQQADVVVYDRLVTAEIIALTRRDAEKIYVGKQHQHHNIPQESINALLVRLAKAGKRVVRLKGGDPFIFGRGGEEMESLMAEGIAFQVVPGITAALGCAAYAGIPLTHRDHAQTCIFVTGHRKDGTIQLNWPQLVLPQQTVVIYMGLLGLETICHQLIQHGAAADLPIAIVQRGTTPQQQLLIGTLASLPEQVADEPFDSPTLIIIGTVVRLHQQLNWFNPTQLVDLFKI
jgi:uroporphyrin-III C-methyltransferase/precorrin-2 dehydrogenase/sirohydrochlorin ferrochelatase